MTLKRLISFLGGLIFTGLIYALIVYIIVFATFSLAGQTLTEKENREAFFFYTIFFITVATTYIIVRRFKTNRKFSAVGICIPLLFALYAFFKLGQIYADNLNYRQTFDKTKWTESESKPFKMAKTLIKSKTLIGQSKQQVFDKLGTTKDSIKNEKVDFLRYWTDNGTWQIRLYFKNDRVIDAYLYEEGLDL